MANYIYDYATSRLSVIHSYKMAEDIMDKTFTYTKAGDVETITDNRTDTTTSYVYDHCHRLISEQFSGTGAATGTSVEVIEFTYEETDGKPVHAPKEVTINGSLTEYDYTLTGNRSFETDGFTTTNYESNDDNMISKISAGGTETLFFYDADNRRIKKTQGLSSTLYFGDKFEIVKGTPTLYVFAGNLRVAQVTDTSMAFFHKDHLGSTSAISREDGTVIDFGEYLPYGLDRNTNALLQYSPYKFTDQEQDEGTGLYNYDARLYDPVLGQFIMADTIVPDLFNPQSLNRYAYCLNNPLKYTDPTGHFGIAGAAIGAFNGALSAGISAARAQEASLGQIAGAVALGATIGAMTGSFGQMGLSGTFGTAIGGFVGASVGSYTAEGITNAALGKGFQANKKTAAINGLIGAGAAVLGKVATVTDNAAALLEGHIGRVGGLIVGVTTGTRNGLNPTGGREDNSAHPGICEADISEDPTSPTGDRTGSWSCNETNSTGNYNHGSQSSNPRSPSSGDSSSDSGRKIICVELYRQGLLTDEIFQADERFGDYLATTKRSAIIGYHFWAKPVVKMMQSSKAITKIVYFIAKPWTEEMAYRMNVLDKGNLWGYILMELGIPLCHLIGFIICNLSGVIWLGVAVTIVIINPFQFRSLSREAVIS